MKTCHLGSAPSDRLAPSLPGQERPDDVGHLAGYFLGEVVPGDVVGQRPHLGLGALPDEEGSAEGQDRDVEFVPRGRS